MSVPSPIRTLDVPFSARQWVSSMGARWNPDLRVWTYSGARLPPALEIFQAKPLSIEWHAQAHLNGGKHLDPIIRQEPFFEPRPHQEEAIEAIVRARKTGSPGFLLADEVGVGKTMSAWGFAKRDPELVNTLIITTASAQAHWRRCILHAGWRPGQGVMIINYDRLDRLFAQPEKGLSSTRRKGKRKRIAKQGKAPEYDLVIVDESHKGKNPESARGLMMQKITSRAKFSIWASATAGKDPVDLVYLGRLLAHATGKKVPMDSKDDFAQWCQSQGLAVKKGAYGRIEWERNDHDLEKIRGWLFGGRLPLGIRRLPEEISGWKAIEREMMPLDLPAESLISYAKAWNEFVEIEIKGRGKGRQASQEIEKNRMRLRQQASWLMVTSTVELVKDVLENDKRAAVSVGFRQTQDEMVRQLAEAGIEAAMIHGQMSADEKEAQRLDFQQGRKPCIVFTVEEAISLHQGEYEDVPRVLMIHDIRWSAIQMAQIEGRCHRDGAFAPVWWLAAADTVMVEIAQLMASRVAAMKAMHGDATADLEAIESLLSRYVQAAGR